MGCDPRLRQALELTRKIKNYNLFYLQPLMTNEVPDHILPIEITKQLSKLRVNLTPKAIWLIRNIKQINFSDDFDINNDIYKLLQLFIQLAIEENLKNTDLSKNNFTTGNFWQYLQECRTQFPGGIKLEIFSFSLGI